MRMPIMVPRSPAARQGAALLSDLGRSRPSLHPPNDSPIIGGAAVGTQRTVTSTKAVVQQHWSPPPPLPETSLAVTISR